MNPVKEILIFAIRGYRVAISPLKTLLFGPLSGCRFTPTCSQYAIEALQNRGALIGLWLAIKRICRCHPWGGCGHDPVPDCVGRRTRTVLREAYTKPNMNFAQTQREST